MNKIFSQNKEKNTGLQVKKKKVFTKMLNHLARPWGLAKNLEHISNRSRRKKK